MLKIGIGSSKIRFSQEIFPNPRENYTGIHDDPLVHAVIALSEEKFCFIFADLVDPGDWEAIRQQVADTTQTRFEHVMLHTSHVLSTPHCMKKRDYKNSLDEYHDLLQRKDIFTGIEEAVREAEANVAEAKIGIGYAVSGINTNRVLETRLGYASAINEKGDSEHCIPVICIRDLQDKIRGVIYTVNTAAAVLEGSRCSGNTRLVSGDIASGSSRMLKDMWGIHAVYTIGASGDQWPVLRAVWDYKDKEGCLKKEDYQEKGFFIVELLSRRLAQAVSEELQNISCFPADEPLKMYKLNITLPGHERLAPPVAREITREVEFVPSEDVDTEVYFWTLGDAVMIGCQPELCVSTLRNIRKASPFKHVVLLEFVNGMADYMVTEEHYEKCTQQCKKGCFAKGAAEIFEEKVISFLHSIYKK